MSSLLPADSALTWIAIAMLLGGLGMIFVSVRLAFLGRAIISGLALEFLGLSLFVAAAIWLGVTLIPIPGA